MWTSPDAVSNKAWDLKFHHRGQSGLDQKKENKNKVASYVFSTTCYAEMTKVKFVMAVPEQLEVRTPYSRVFINHILRKKKKKKG